MKHKPLRTDFHDDGLSDQIGAVGVGGSWGRVVVVRRDIKGYTHGGHWFARENFHSGGVVPFTPALQVDAAVRIGAAAWRDCPECGNNELMRSDDFLCIICREDPWLDDSNFS